MKMIYIFLMFFGFLIFVEVVGDSTPQADNSVVRTPTADTNLFMFEELECGQLVNNE